MISRHCYSYFCNCRIMGSIFTSICYLWHFGIFWQYFHHVCSVTRWAEGSFVASINHCSIHSPESFQKCMFACVYVVLINLLLPPCLSGGLIRSRLVLTPDPIELAVHYYAENSPDAVLYQLRPTMLLSLCWQHNYWLMNVFKCEAKHSRRGPESARNKLIYAKINNGLI